MKVISQKHTPKKSWTMAAALGIAVFASSLFSAPASADTLDAALNEQVMMVPAYSGAQPIQLETTIFKPPGIGPFPVVVMNHGKALGDPHSQSRDRFHILSREFVKRGYAVVIPMRKGFSHSTGQYIEYGCNMIAHGLSQADDLQSTLEFLRTQTWADSERILVAGQSYGGLTAIAFGARYFPGVKGVINFAGGLKVHGGGCQWQDSLVQAFSTFGASSRLPTLWFYGANDQHFNPELATRMRDAYVSAGGTARLVAYGPFRRDAHGMVATRDGVQIWWPETEKFLHDIGLPTAPVLALDDEEEVKVPEVQYAAIDDVAAIPYLQESGREQYRAFLDKAQPRAFAVSPSGGWSWAEEGEDPVTQALADCNKNSGGSCKLYAVNDNVVWTGEPTNGTLMAAHDATADSTSIGVEQTPVATSVTGR